MSVLWHKRKTSTKKKFFFHSRLRPRGFEGASHCNAIFDSWVARQTSGSALLPTLTAASWPSASGQAVPCDLCFARRASFKSLFPSLPWMCFIQHAAPPSVAWTPGLNYDHILPSYIWDFPHFHFVSGKIFTYVSFKIWACLTSFRKPCGCNLSLHRPDSKPPYLGHWWLFYWS